MSLSGGERQRIALAGAFLKDAPILILDEPASSLDIETEAAIIDAMERLIVQRTTFIIAQRTSVLKGCDVIFRTERGVLRKTANGTSLDSCPFLKSENFVDALVEPYPKYHSPKLAATSCDESVAAIDLIRIPVNELRIRQAAKYASPRC